MATKGSKKRAKSAETEQILKMLKVGVAGTDIAERVGCKPSRVYSIKRYYKDEIEVAQVSNNTLDISRYNDDIDTILKSNILRLGNTIANYNIEKASLSQLTTAFGIMYDKLRLHQGKSTSNNAVQILHNINPEQLEIIESAVKSLKKSMLS